MGRADYRIVKLQKPSPAMLVALVAMFVALGGSSYAALALPKNSVGKEQLKKNSVTSVKVKRGSLLTSDFKASQRKKLRGPQGVQGVAGTQGVQGAPGTQGVPGETGPAGPFPDGAIPSGKTIRGAFFIRGESADLVIATALSFGFRLASAPVQHFVGQGATPPPECPGTPATPEAQAGHLCIYETLGSNRGSLNIFDPGANTAGSGREGVVIEVNETSPGAVTTYGTWAVTSP